MANVLGELFQGIADAIRSKTGGTDKLVPNGFAAAIESIVVGSGESSGGTTGSGLKIASGSFEVTLEDAYTKRTIEHGLGVMPDFVFVYADGYAYFDYDGDDASADGDDALAMISKKSLLAAWGMKTEFASSYVSTYKYLSGGIAPVFSLTKTNLGLDNTGSTSPLVRCPDDSTFVVGSPDGSTYPFANAASYKWIAIAGMGSTTVANNDVHYVTFMNKDGTEELGKKAVADGDDCADPIARGLFDTPTEESTDQYDFTFSGGWATVPNGGADANALKAVTEDRVVYADFIATLRTYTITYLDEDGETVLYTELVPYGTIPSYVPTKDGVAFDSWTPTPVAVTGEASYTAVWTSEVASGTFSGGPTWTLYTDGLLTISGSGTLPNYKGDKYQSGSASYPHTNGPLYPYIDQITKVEIGYGVTSVGGFYGFKALTSVSIPSSVTTIGDCAFSGCSSLAEVTLPDSITYIGVCSFYSCSSLTSITIPSGVTTIGNTAFSGCSKLTDVTLPSNLASIGTSVFYGCGITSIDLPASLTSIGNTAFTSCTKLTSITIPSGVTSIGLKSFHQTGIASATFENTAGWWVTTDSTATSGDAVDVSDPATAATYLKTTYYNYYWYRS